MELKDAMKLANTLADLEEGELKTVLTFAEELRERGGKSAPKAKRKYTRRAKTEEAAAPKKRGPKPKKAAEVQAIDETTEAVN